MRARPSFLRRNASALLLCAAVFVLTYIVVFRFRTGSSDYTLHAVWAMAMTPASMLRSFFDGSERLWHIFVKLVYGLTGNMWVSSALVTAAANGAAAFLLDRFLGDSRPEGTPRWLVTALLLALFTADALTLPGQEFYKSSGAINTWHNPTNIMVRPFAAAVFWITARIYIRRREPDGSFRFDGGFWRQFRAPVYRGAEVVLYPLCILLSAYAKPSFLQFFAPAILLFLVIDLIRTRGMLLPFCVKLALAYLPAALILLSQFTSFFGGGISAAETGDTGTAEAAAGVAVYFLEKSFSGSGALLTAIGKTLLSVLRLLAFPLFLLAVEPRRFFREPVCRLGVFCAAIGFLESVLLHETGTRALDGNFLWGYYLSAWFLWFTAVFLFIRLYRDRSGTGKLVRGGGSLLLTWHFLSGAAYYIQILRTAQYYF